MKDPYTNTTESLLKTHKTEIQMTKKQLLCLLFLYGWGFITICFKLIVDCLLVLTIIKITQIPLNISSLELSRTQQLCNPFSFLSQAPF